MRLKSVLIVIGLSLFIQPAIALADTVIVSKTISGCDYFIATGRKGYYVLEWFGGHDPDVGDSVSGVLDSYGFQDVHYNDDDDTDGRIYVEDYGIGGAEALEKLVDSCH